mmetsp:Transcript_79701/g.133124  ORF Transcript_79701/g.133124 Transcript_79701/m.133124 type:complete len:212 (+) Transcript_79701:866-1501(+)
MSPRRPPSGRAFSGKSLHIPPSQYTWPSYRKGSIIPGTPPDMRTATCTGRSGSVSGVSCRSRPVSSAVTSTTSRFPKRSFTCPSVMLRSPTLDSRASAIKSCSTAPLLMPGPLHLLNSCSKNDMTRGPSRFCSLKLPKMLRILMKATRDSAPSSGSAILWNGRACTRSNSSSAVQPTESIAAMMDPADTPASVSSCSYRRPCRSSAFKAPT